jgi:arabinogalactan endo-1,4-beta-galactosidase
MRVKLLFFFILAFIGINLTAQPFYFGADLSYVNEMEDCGAVYKVSDVAMDPYSIMKDHGCNLVRIRLWHTPSWYDQLNDGERYSDFEDVRKSILRAKTSGLQVLLDYHLSDTWADPGHQVVPAAWDGVVDNQAVLGDSLRNYILYTLTRLGDEGLLPDIIQIGNETNKGILLSQEVNDQGWSVNWQRNVFLFQTALTAIEEISAAYSVPIKTAIHIADPSDVAWYVEQFALNGFTGYDIIGISYYWQWHQPVTISQVGQLITSLKEDYPGKEVMIFETAYGWTTQNADGANNILFNTHPSYAPLSPANQKKWMVDLTQTVIDHGGSGVVYWEPAWVSTGCETQWVTGSSWDNATFFDFDNKVITDGGIGWMEHGYDFTSSTDYVPTLSERLELSYADEEIKIRNTGNLHLSFPCTIILYAPDGKVILSRRIDSADGDMISIPFPGLLSGCYMASLKDAALVKSSGKICIVNP